MEHVVCKTFYKFLEIHQFVELRGHSWHRKSGNSCYRLLNHIPRWLLFHYKMRISTSVLCGFLSLLIPHQNFCLDYVDHDPHIPQVLKNTASNWEKKKMDKVPLKAANQKMVSQSTHQEWKMNWGYNSDHLLGYVNRLQATLLFFGSVPDPQACFILHNPDPQWLTGPGWGPDPKLSQPDSLS